MTPRSDSFTPASEPGTRASTNGPYSATNAHHRWARSARSSSSPAPRSVRMRVRNGEVHAELARTALECGFDRRVVGEQRDEQLATGPPLDLGDRTVLQQIERDHARGLLDQRAVLVEGSGDPDRAQHL